MKLPTLIMLLLLPALHLDIALAESRQSPAPNDADKRGVSFAQFARGGKLYQENCATCHGNRAQGMPNWTKRGPDGKYPAPPLNGTGHAWHHAKPALARTIRQGTLKIGGSMPPWGDKLSGNDIDDIIAWIILQWPDEIYDVWSKQSGRHQ